MSFIKERFVGMFVVVAVLLLLTLVVYVHIPLSIGPITDHPKALPPVIHGTITGISSDGQVKVQVPMDLNDSIGTVYACWDMLESISGNRCGTCFVHPGSLMAGRTMGLARRSSHPQDKDCWVGIDRGTESKLDQHTEKL